MGLRNSQNIHRCVAERIDTFSLSEKPSAQATGIAPAAQQNEPGWRMRWPHT